jgi:DNA polymerase I
MAATSSPILLLDAFSLVYRAFFALPPMTTSRGEPTSALYGFSALLLKLFREQSPQGAAVAVDRPTPTFRHLRYPAYKRTRQRAPSPLGQQLARLDDLLEAFGFPIFAATGFEADDVIATLVRELVAAGDSPMPVTGDLDALQCARGGTRVHIVGRGPTQGRTYDQALVETRYGVAPAELPDWKALAGDPSDDLPGVPGVGAKTATALVRRFGGVAGLLARLDQVQPARLREKLAGHAEDLVMWRDLAQLRDDVPLHDGPRWAPLDAAARERVRAIFEELEFRSLMPRLLALP